MMDRLSAWTGEYLRLSETLSLEDKRKIKREAKRNKKLIFLFSLIANLLILGVVKYSNSLVGTSVRFWNALNDGSVESLFKIF